MITIIRLKSDNFDCWVSEEAYQEIRLQMSTGDWHTHKHKELQVEPNQLEDIKFHRNVDFVDFVTMHDDGSDPLWYFYAKDGDCVVEAA